MHCRRPQLVNIALLLSTRQCACRPQQRAVVSASLLGCLSLMPRPGLVVRANPVFFAAASAGVRLSLSGADCVRSPGAEPGGSRAAGRPTARDRAGNAQPRRTNAAPRLEAHIGPLLAYLGQGTTEPSRIALPEEIELVVAPDDISEEWMTDAPERTI